MILAIYTSTTNSTMTSCRLRRFKRRLPEARQRKLPTITHAYTCDGSGCTLLPNTTYFLMADSTSSGLYYWEFTNSLNETAVPSGNGWSIGLGWNSGDGGATWITYNDVGKFKVTATANP